MAAYLSLADDVPVNEVINDGIPFNDLLQEPDILDELMPEVVLNVQSISCAGAH
jgi:hypothetical protein